MSLEGLDDASDVTRQTEDWISATDSRTARLALVGIHFDLGDISEGSEHDIVTTPLRPEYEQSDNGACSTPALSLRTASISSFRAPAPVRPGNGAAIPLPLTSDRNSCDTDATPTESSIETDLAPGLGTTLPLLEDHEGVLEQPRSQIPIPIYECPFWFLSCGFISRSQQEWETHGESHFRGEDPPNSVECPLCDWRYHTHDGRVAWNNRMQHVALEHTMLGQTLIPSRPDFPLFHHLWKKRLIDNLEYEELLGGDRPPANFVETNRRERRRERDGRRHRRQHVTTSRPPGSQIRESFVDRWVTTGEDRHRPTVSPEDVESQRDLGRTPAGLHESAPQSSQLNAAHDDRGDSGYGTNSNNGLTTSKNHEDDSISVRTILSDASRIFQPPEERRNLIIAFVKDFREDVKIYDLPEQATSRAVAQLSDLLKMFSLRLGAIARSQEERNAKDFVRQQRNHIVQCFREYHEISDAIKETTMSDISQASMSYEDRIAHWNTDGMVLEDVAETMDTTEVAEEYTAELEKEHTAELEEEHAAELEEEFVDEPLPAPLYQQVRSFLRHSSAYKLLVQRAQHAAKLGGSKHGAMDEITQAMHNVFASLYRKYSKTTRTYEISFTLDWDLPGFLHTQAYDARPDVALGNAITITGSGTDAQAMTCAEYMQQVWPSTGPEVLLKMQHAVAAEMPILVDDTISAISTSLQSFVADDLDLEINFLPNRTSIKAYGNQAALTELSEQLAWLGSALRPSLTPNGVTFVKPRIDNTSIHEDKPGAYVHIGFIDTTADRDDPDTSFQLRASCWHAMFRNPTVVTGYPILARDRGECGLQIPFRMLCALAEAYNLTSHSSTLLLKGQVTMLIPTARTDRSVTWHFMHNENGKRLAYTTFLNRCSSWVDGSDIDPEDVVDPDMVHYVGWCPSISRHFGTKANTYEAIEYAGVKTCTAGYAIEQKLTISASRYISFGGAIVRGNRDRAEFVKYSGYSSQIEFARRLPVLLYDTATQQAWLTDGASALLHIARTQVVKKPYGGDDSLFDKATFNPTPFAHSDPSGSSDAAMIALRNSANMKHKVLREFQSYADEKIVGKSINIVKEQQAGSSLGDTQNPSGNEEVYKTTSFKELVCQTWNTLEQIYDRQMEEAVDHTVKPLQSPFQTRLEGYEYMDIVSAKHRLTRRGISLDTNGSIWLPFVKRIHAITLFAKHFGELYQPTQLSKKTMCEQWTSVPRGQEYLVAPVSLLREIRQNSVEEGEVGDSVNELAEGVFWCPSSDAFKPCGPRCNHIILGRVQQLSSKGKSVMKSASTNQMCPDDGAVLFGESSILNVPRMQRGSHQLLQPDNTFHDSGLGSSIQSATTQSSSANPDVSQPATQDIQTSRPTSDDISDASQPTLSASSNPLERDSSNATSSASDSGSRSSPQAPPPQLIAQTVLRVTSHSAPPAQKPSDPVAANLTPSNSKPPKTKGSIKSVWRKLEARLRRARK